MLSTWQGFGSKKYNCLYIYNMYAPYAAGKNLYFKSIKTVYLKKSYTFAPKQMLYGKEFSDC